MSKLFQPLKIGNFDISNRIALAPLTRLRVSDDHIPLDFVAEYYSQRASTPGTFLITEATIIAPAAGGYYNSPGIYNQAQIDSWKNVTAAVHAKKSFIFLQLQAQGRTAWIDALKADGPYTVKAPSNICLPNQAVPDPLTVEEIQEYIGWFARAAKNAIAAGFDGVEIHGANGYLVDQFLQSISNGRTDAYGGSIENRARFGLEVTKAVIAAVGKERTGIRLSPFANFNGMPMKDPVPQFSYMASELKKLDIAYLHAIDARQNENGSEDDFKNSIKFLGDIWGPTKPFLIAAGLTPELAKKELDDNYSDVNAVAVFGRYFISNPDLVFRIKEGVQLSPYDRSTFYLAKERTGYVDYPFSKEFEASVGQGNEKTVNNILDQSKAETTNEMSVRIL